MIKHVITRVNPEKTEKKGGYFSHLSSYELGQRADLCSMTKQVKLGLISSDINELILI